MKSTNQEKWVADAAVFSLPAWKAQTRLLEQHIWQRIDQIAAKYAFDGEIISTRLSSSQVTFVYILDSGQHIVNDFPLEEIIAFANSIPVDEPGFH